MDEYQNWIETNGLVDPTACALFQYEGAQDLSLASPCQRLDAAPWPLLFIEMVVLLAYTAVGYCALYLYLALSFFIFKAIILPAFSEFKFIFSD
jgi:hypothetical protein